MYINTYREEIFICTYMCVLFQTMYFISIILSDTFFDFDKYDVTNY